VFEFIGGVGAEQRLHLSVRRTSKVKKCNNKEIEEIKYMQRIYIEFVGRLGQINDRTSYRGGLIVCVMMMFTKTDSNEGYHKMHILYAYK
jgi:hypothetical protein